MFAIYSKYFEICSDIIFYIRKRGVFMQLSDAVQQRILNLCKERNISITKLSTNSGLPSSTVFSIFYGKSCSPKLSTILHMCEGLNIELTDFFDDPLFKDVNFEDD